MDSETEGNRTNGSKVGKWLAGILGAVLTSVLIFWLTEGLRKPTPETPGGPPQPSRPVSNENRSADTQTDVGPISVRCSANPYVLSPGGQTELVIQAISSQNTPITDANVRIEAGGGEFLSSGSTTVVGRTDYKGSFRTFWKCPSPAASGYDMDVYVSKPRFDDGEGKCRTIIK